MPPKESTSQPIPESSTLAVEAPTPAAEPITPPQEAPPATTAPDAPPAPTEAVPAPETASASAEATAGTQPTTPTAQIPPNEPLPPEPEPFDSAQDKPTLAPEPPSVAASTAAPAHPIRDFLNKARIATQDRKRKKRDKIMFALATKNKITNDEVEKLLHVSDATATRYLSALEKEGKIIQVGKQGKGILYIKTP